MNYIMPCFTTLFGDLTPLLRLLEKKINKNKQKESTPKNQHLKLKAPSNNVKIQSEENLTIKIYFFVTTKLVGLYIHETR